MNFAMMTDNNVSHRTLKNFEVPDSNIYITGLFDEGVTLLSQQKRALNLVFCLSEEQRIKTNPYGEQARSVDTTIAIVGGGFSGLTVAAGLIRKGANAKITIFERLDTLLPLQQGSDTRWLHPNIYNWPEQGSELSSAMLPLLNWTAARASDVAVQVLNDWKEIARGHPDLSVFCNTRHLRVSPRHELKHQIEWVGEPRNLDGTISEQSIGKSKTFDIVILAIGFGIEKDGARSYWRNDVSGQPNLQQQRQTYLVSGQGDGAIIDLLRLRISNFRQDRILSEMFSDSSNLRNSIKEFYNSFKKFGSQDFVNKMHELEEEFCDEFKNTIKKLTNRLRRDTEVILNTKEVSIEELIKSDNVRMSFQNRLMIYFLYRCGGFIPSTGNVKSIAKKYGIINDNIIIRRGTDRIKSMKSFLSKSLIDVIKKNKTNLKQSDKAIWPGGYFGQPGTLTQNKNLTDVNNIEFKKKWRREYLPGATELVSSAFCSSVAGLLSENYNGERLRVTLHRSISFGLEEVLQQCCPYFGIGLSSEGVKSNTVGEPGRTFPARNATIGAAYSTKRVIRSKKGVNSQALKTAMQSLNLNEASSEMSSTVNFLLAIPILEPSADPSSSAVVAILYVDSVGEFYVEDSDLKRLVLMTKKFFDGIDTNPVRQIESIYNLRIPSVENDSLNTHKIDVLPNEIEEIESVEPPRTDVRFQLNFDYSDFVPVEEI